MTRPPVQRKGSAVQANGREGERGGGGGEANQRAPTPTRIPATSCVSAAEIQRESL